MTEYVVIEGTARMGLATNDTGGSAADATSGPVGYAHLCGATVNAAPITAGITVDLLSEATWPPGCYQVSIAATAANGFAAGSDYDIWVQGTVDSETPVGYVGKLKVRAAGDTLDLAIVRLMDISDAAAVKAVTGAVGSVTGAVGSVTATVNANLTQILGTALTETAGYLAAGFKKFFNVLNPTGTLLSIPDAVPGATGGLGIVGSQMDLVDAPNATAITAIQSGLGTSANQTTILARIGDFAGTGLNTLKGFFQALFRDDAGVTGANAPSEINEVENAVAGAYDGLTDSQEAQVDVGVNMKAISTDSSAADALETMLDGTGGNVLTLGQLRINSSAAGGGIDIDNSAGPGISATAAGGDGAGIVLQGNGLGAGLLATGGTTGAGVRAIGGTTNMSGLHVSGEGSGNGLYALGGLTGNGIRALGGGTSGDGINAAAVTSGDGIDATGKGGGVGLKATGQGAGAGVLATGGATGHGASLVGGATSGDGLNATATTAGDGIEAVGVGGGYDVNADVQGNLSGSVGSVTGGATAANQTTILNRLGSWTGSARNTILGAFQALFRKDADATVPSDVNADLGAGAGTADNTTDSTEAIRDTAPLGTAMRGTDSAALAASWTATRAGYLDELAAANIPADVDAILADTGTDGVLVAADAIADAQLAADTDVYEARATLFVDDANAEDSYAVGFHKNGAPVTSGITVPVLTVYQMNVAGTVLVNGKTLLQASSLGFYYYDTTTECSSAGVAYMAKVTATIDGSSRTMTCPVGRDSSA